MITKICTKCGEEKDLENFCVDKRLADQHASECKSCKLKRDAKWFAEHPEKRKEYNARSKAKCPPEKIKEYSARYYSKHSEQIIQYSALWHAKHPDKSRAYSAKWSRTENGKISRRATAARQRKTERGKLSHIAQTNRRRATGSLTTDELQEMKAASNGICPYCLRPIENGHWDHMYPVSRGGKTERSNMLWVCADCNKEKRGHLLTSFLSKRSRIASYIWEKAVAE
jgi:hypothetical protein